MKKELPQHDLESLWGNSLCRLCFFVGPFIGPLVVDVGRPGVQRHHEVQQLQRHVVVLARQVVVVALVGVVVGVVNVIRWLRCITNKLKTLIATKSLISIGAELHLTQFFDTFVIFSIRSVLNPDSVTFFGHWRLFNHGSRAPNLIYVDLSTPALKCHQAPSCTQRLGIESLA